MELSVVEIEKIESDIITHIQVVRNKYLQIKDILLNWYDRTQSESEENEIEENKIKEKNLLNNVNKYAELYDELDKCLKMIRIIKYTNGNYN